VSDAARAPQRVEIERKFLLGSLPDDIDRHPHGDLEQGYLAVADDGVEVRVRRSGDDHVLTVKSGPGLVRVEEEMPIEARRFASLWELTRGRRLAKTRYLVDIGDGLTAEVDVYHEDLAGLLTAEIEFPTEEASLAFVPPAWLGTEVTGDARYANRTLATDGAP
jgi:adenylate cyclase